MGCGVKRFPGKVEVVVEETDVARNRVGDQRSPHLVISELDSCVQKSQRAIELLDAQLLQYQRNFQESPDAAHPAAARHAQ